MRCDDKLVSCLVIFTKRDLSNPRIDKYVKEMITNNKCRIKSEEAGLEYSLSEEDQVRRRTYGCCDVCSPETEKWPIEEDDRQRYTVGNQDLVSYLQDYFMAENKKRSSLGIMHLKPNSTRTQRRTIRDGLHDQASC